jgi:hypothetical protein
MIRDEERVGHRSLCRVDAECANAHEWVLAE